MDEYIRYEDLPLRTKNGRLVDVEFTSNVYLGEASGDPVTLSLGGAIFPEHGATSTEILRKVDAALYRAKCEGRSRVVLAE